MLIFTYSFLYLTRVQPAASLPRPGQIPLLEFVLGQVGIGRRAVPGLVARTEARNLEALGLCPSYTLLTDSRLGQIGKLLEPHGTHL